MGIVHSKLIVRKSFVKGLYMPLVTAQHSRRPGPVLARLRPKQVIYVRIVRGIWLVFLYNTVITVYTGLSYSEIIYFSLFTGKLSKTK